MRSASVYCFPDRLLVLPNCATTMGLRVSPEPYAVLPLEATEVELGAAAASALATSERTVAHPTDWKANAAPRLMAAGVASEQAFQRRSALVQLSGSGSILEVVPSHNGGARGSSKGFTPIIAAGLSLPASVTPEILGREVRLALTRCTS